MHAASAGIADADTRAATTKAVEDAVRTMNEKVAPFNLSVELER
jgi:hypothetical protein